MSEGHPPASSDQASDQASGEASDRRPSRRPARLSALAKLPLFLDLADRRVVLALGDPALAEAAAWKAELLAAAGARVDVFAPEPDPELEAVIAGSGGRVRRVPRPWREADLGGQGGSQGGGQGTSDGGAGGEARAWLALAAESDAAAAARFAAAARARGILVNVVDDPQRCDFQFGTIVNRSPVVVGIMTDGAAPILGQAIRRRVEAILPPALGAWGRVAKGFRERLAELLPGKPARRRFWEHYVDAVFTAGREEGGAAIRERLEALAAREAREGGARRPGIGEVVLVGAGPGDPELLTLRAMRELQAADVIVHDRLVTAEVLELARREARRIHVGKEGHGAACRQEDISALLVDLALAGERVVRLKGGDPGVFGRLNEELAACRAAGVPIRIVPGVTTASAAAAAAGVSLTERGRAQRLQFVTGHDRHGRLPPDLDFAALADPGATTVIYMGRRTAAALAAALSARGLPDDTPALVARDVAREGEDYARTTLAGLARGDALGDDRAPTLVMIGAALAAPADATIGAGVAEAPSPDVAVAAAATSSVPA